MKTKFLIMCLCLGLLSGCSTAAKDVFNPSPMPIFEKEHSGVWIVLTGGTPKLGHAYLMEKKYSHVMRVHQNLEDGLLLAPSSWALPQLAIHLSTDQRIADQGVLPFPTCAVYEGLWEYTTVENIKATVHSFREISCEGYPTEPQKPKLVAVEQSPPEETKPVESPAPKFIPRDPEPSYEPPEALAPSPPQPIAKIPLEIALQSYVSRTERLVKSYWAPPIAPYSFQISAIVSIDRLGNLLNIRLNGDAGIVQNQAVIAAIKASAPFDPLPEGYEKPQLDIELTFNMQRR